MNPEMLIVVDDEDRFLRHAPREECHRGDGLQHRAVLLLLHDARRRLLLQRRRHNLFDGLWDLAGATHPRHMGGRDESYEEAAARCLQAEWRTEAPLRSVLAFRYFARDGDRCENEYCVLLAGETDPDVAPHLGHAYAHRWITWHQLGRELSSTPQGFTPWLRSAIAELRPEHLPHLVTTQRR
jgi:isopentenyl-diphosphate delta-isomerase